MSNWLSKTFGKVRVDRLIARGGMAEVYLGTHTTLERQVAIKVLLSHLEDEPDLQDRFQREARVLAGLRHANIVQIFDYDVVDGQPFIVMEYVAGPSLNTYLRELHKAGGQLTLPQVGRLLAMLAAAIDYAHSQGVVHRDIKPANILLHTRGNAPDIALPPIENVEPILTDFGLLRLVDSASKSTTGTVAGTPTYMSPEQAMGAHVDGRSDLYSLGIVVYELLSGRVPFDADTTMGILMKHIQEPPPPLPDLPHELQTVMEKILAKRPDARYDTARDFAAAFMEAANLTAEDFTLGASVTHRRSKATVKPTSSTEGAEPTLPPQTAATLTAAPRKKKAWPFVALAGIIGVLLIVAVVAAFNFPAPDKAVSTPAAEATQPAPAAPTTAAVDNTVFGLVRFHDVVAYLDEVTISTENMPVPPAGFQYQAWLVSGEKQLPIGYLQFDAAGNGQLSYVDSQGRNLAGLYDSFMITQEPDPDPSTLPSGNIVYSSGVPPEALEHLRHLVYSYSDTPNNTSYVAGLITYAEMIDSQVQAMLTASEAQDAEGIKKAAEIINNIIVGKQSDKYSDLDGDGTIDDPSDGYGLLLNGDNSGYIEGAIHHASVAATMDDASMNIQLHTPHVTDSAKNIEEWSLSLRDLVLAIAADPLGSQTNAQIRQAISLANRILNGQDLNGNEKVDPIIGEGGVETIHEHAEYMLDMPILLGVNRLPSAEPAATSMPDPHSTDQGTATPSDTEDPYYLPGYGP